MAQVIEAIGQGIYGLDLFEEQLSGRLLVCEVNQNPEFDKSSKIHGVDVADHIGEYIKRILDGTNIKTGLTIVTAR